MFHGSLLLNVLWWVLFDNDNTLAEHVVSDAEVFSIKCLLSADVDRRVLKLWREKNLAASIVNTLFRVILLLFAAV